MASATGAELWKREGIENWEKKGGGGSNNVSPSVAEDRGYNLSTEDQRQGSTKACCTNLSAAQTEASYHSSAANNKWTVLL